MRVTFAAALAFTLLDLALYFFALALLICGKAFGVVRQALVPELVDETDQLVAANSRLARLNVIAGAIGAASAAPCSRITHHPTVTLALACVFFAAAGVVTPVAARASRRTT